MRLSHPYPKLWILYLWCLRIEFSLSPGWCGAHVHTDDERCFRAGLALPFLFSLSLSVERGFTRVRPGGWRDDLRRGREVSVHFHDGAMWLKLWARTDEWNRSDPWWMHWHVCPMDILFGRLDCDHHALATYDREATFPDAGVGYPEVSRRIVVEVGRWRWKRPRLPWYSLDAIRCQVDCEDGVPFDGKRGPDHNYSTTFAIREDLDVRAIVGLDQNLREPALADIADHAVREYVKSIGADRHRR